MAKVQKDTTGWDAVDALTDNDIAKAASKIPLSKIPLSRTKISG